MKKQSKPKRPINLKGYPDMEVIVKALKSGSKVIVCDAVMRRYFGISWAEYKKKYLKK